MSTASSAQPEPPRPAARARRSDASPWNWLLVIPVIACLVPPWFNRVEPRLWSVPFFYWYQMAVIPVGVLATVIVYRQLARRAAGNRRDGENRA